jgi:NhaA family Na+:H+ antiporter
VGRPLAAFLDIEAASGLFLLAATVAALVWANSPWDQSYVEFWHTEIAVTIGNFSVSEDLTHWVNDGLMTIFFFVVGLEIKRELVAGELRDRSAALLPGIAALGGMIVPAVLFLAVNVGGDGEAGWGIPMATDIAFALALVAVFGSRVPPRLKVFLLTLAIVDDIGAIVVIAVFYTDSVSLGWLAEAAVLGVAVYVLRRANVRYLPVYVVLGCALWLAMFESGVHATIAGVILGLLTPAKPFQAELEAEALVDELDGRDDLKAEDVHRTARLIRESVSPAERIEHALHPWTSFVIIPVFALANAGVVLTAEPLRDVSPVVVGIVLGLVVGKLVGITLFSWLATRLPGVDLPEGVRWSQVIGIAAVAGIGFSVSLFITDLAFDDAVLQSEAKLAILIASVAAAAIGFLILSTASHYHYPRKLAAKDGYEAKPRQ